MAQHKYFEKSKTPFRLKELGLSQDVAGSSDDFPTSLPSHGYHIAKASKCTHILGDGEDSASLAGQPKPVRQAFVMFLAFELRTSPTTKACQNPLGKSGLSSMQKVGRVPGEVQARWP